MAAKAGEHTCKLVLVGNGSVGKTSICARFRDDGFSYVYKQTVGIDFYEKRLKIRGDETVTLQVHDIGGQSISSKMLDAYLHGAQVVLLCYDVTDPKSFYDLDDWLERVRQACSKDEGSADPRAGTKSDYDAAAATPGNPHIHLLGNKIDLLHARRVDDKQHERFISRENLDGGFFVSARNGDQVMRSVYDVAGRSVGIKLSEAELEFHDKVIVASVAAKEDGADARGSETDEQRRMREQDEASAAKLRAALESGQDPGQGGAGGSGPCCVVS